MIHELTVNYYKYSCKAEKIKRYSIIFNDGK